jgi:hypothetical protein
MERGHARPWARPALACCLVLAGCVGAGPEAGLPAGLPGPAVATEPPAPVEVPGVVRLGATRDEVEAALGEPARIVEDEIGVETVHLLGLPEPASAAFDQAVLARQAVSTVGGLLGPVGAIGDGLAGRALGGTDAAARPDLARTVMVTITYRDGKAARISRQKLGPMERAGLPAS